MTSHQHSLVGCPLIWFVVILALAQPTQFWTSDATLPTLFWSHFWAYCTFLEFLFLCRFGTLMTLMDSVEMHYEPWSHCDMHVQQLFGKPVETIEPM